jgi:hypothetical protein
MTNGWLRLTMVALLVTWKPRPWNFEPRNLETQEPWNLETQEPWNPVSFLPRQRDGLIGKEIAPAH